MDRRTKALLDFSRYSIIGSAFKQRAEWRHTATDNFIANEIRLEIYFWTRKPKTKS